MYAYIVLPSLDTRLAITALQSDEEMDVLDHHGLSSHPQWKGRLFLVDYEQLTDGNMTRRGSFERSCEDFLGLETSSYNSSRVIGSSKMNTRKNRIDICDANHTRVRWHLMGMASQASQWIKDYLLDSDRVVVPNREHFLEIVDSWKNDPCMHSMGQLSRNPISPPAISIPPTNSSTLDNESESDLIDFAIGGFAKCGASTLMHVTNDVPQIFMGRPHGKVHEVHDLRKGLIDQFREKYKDHKTKFTNDGVRMVNGFKAPEILQSQEFLTNVVKYYPRMDLVISVRHPVLHFQSAYNYNYRHLDQAIISLPDPLSLIGNCGHDCWKKDCVPHINNTAVCTRKSYFHYGLSRLHLTPLQSKDEMDLLDNHELSIHPGWNGRLFLMEIGQLADRNTTRKSKLERAYEDFLGIEANSFSSFRNHSSNNPRLISICDAIHAPIRNLLVEVGGRASRWIKDYLLKADTSRVVVENRDHFISLIDKWGVDPCETDD